MTPATINYLLRWSIPIGTGFGLLIWALVLIRLEHRQKSKRSNSRDH